ncbi:MAG: helix-turn-helix transcriptional regulator [Bacillota bacterium]|nr:helix-turn-helix transcriptional regulator [Bacillota bacterium]
MSFRTTLREVRLERGVTQGAVARMGYVSEPMIQAVEAGRKRLTPDVLGRIARSLRCPELAVAYCRECPANLFIPPWLNRVDQHPLTVLSATVEEAQEALSAIEALHLRNKLAAADISPDDRRRLERAIDQTLDLRAACIMTAAVTCRRFGLDLWALVGRNDEKVRSRYTKEGREAA